MARDSYRHLAGVYDRLMREAPYDRWLSWTEAMWRNLGVDPETVMDLACGTGTLTWLLAESGRTMIGVDRSSEMLAVAAGKQDEKPAVTGEVQWFEQEMQEVASPHPLDAVVCFCDSVNYLLTEDDWRTTFHAVSRALRPGGTFLFDSHSEYKITTLFGNELFAWEEANVYCVWQNELDEHDLLVEEWLTFFVEQDDGRYERFDERHVQRTFSLPTIKRWLREAGLSVLSVTSDFQTSGTVAKTDERLFFCAQKPHG